jgi:pyruvate,water dikinase
MAAVRPIVTFFKDIDKNDLPLVGGKGANLGEMTQAGFPVPNGFAVTVEGYDRFLEENELHGYLLDVLEESDVKDPESLESASQKIQRKIRSLHIPDDVAQETIKGYKKLSGRFKKALVAVRSSATAEDLPGASFAGQQATYLNIKGDANLLESVKACWASLFTARAIFYREENKIKHEKVKISVIIQEMVPSEVSGVMFSIDPVTNDKDRIIVEAVWGLGEMIVQGSVVPDTYVVQKDTFMILSKEISDQRVQLVRRGEKTQEREVPKSWRNKQKLANEEIITLAKIADKLQTHYYFPQDIEWAKSGKDIYITQTRPVTTIGKARAKTVGDIKNSDTPILRGAAASPGIGVGTVRVLKSPKEIGKVKEGDILVAPMTSPDYVPAMRRAVAIVTNEGGLTSHAAIVSRELGVPCVVGTKEATKKLSDGDKITVDGAKGLVFMGATVIKEEPAYAKATARRRRVRTATRVYVNLGEPDRVREIAKRHVDGVGLLRAEFMIANIGIHPKEAIKLKKQQAFIDKLAGDLEKFCKSFGNRPVVYRATDFKTNEYRALTGGKAWEPEEANPLMGFRGAFRYVSQPEVFNLELQAIKKVRENHDNLWMMIPYVRSPEELKHVRRFIATEGFFESSTFKLWMMVELPVNVIQLTDFIKVGIDGVSIGSNDLTMLLLGTDRDNAEVASAFDERSKAVSWALRRVIRVCNKYKVTSSICGQAPSTYEDLVERLVRYGITSISVNPDAIERVRDVIARTEADIIK